MFSIGKVHLIDPGQRIKKVDLWSKDCDEEEGHLRISDLCKIFNWDQIAYVDEDACQIQLNAHFEGPMKGLSTDKFKRNQRLVVVGKKDAANRSNRDSKEQPRVNYGAPLKEHDTFKDILELRQQIQNCLTEVDALLQSVSDIRVV